MADSKAELSEPATTTAAAGTSEPGPSRMDHRAAAIAYAVVSLVGLGVCLFVGWYLLDSPAMADASATSKLAYYVLLGVLGLAVAACLFGAMRSTARLIGSQFGYLLELGAPVVIAALVVCGGFWLTRSSEELTLVLQLRSPDHMTDASEIGVRVALGNRIVKQQFSTIGEAAFSGVSGRFRNKEAYVQLDSKIYRLKGDRATYRIPATFVIALEVVRIPAAELDSQTLYKARNELLLLNIVQASRGVPIDLWAPVPVGEPRHAPLPRREVTAALLRPVDLASFWYFIRQGYSRELLFWLFTDSIRVSVVGKTIEFLNDPDENRSCEIMRDRAECFRDLIDVINVSGLTLESRIGAGSGDGGSSTTKRTMTRLCFDPVLAQRAVRAYPPEILERLPTRSMADQRPRCKDQWMQSPDVAASPFAFRVEGTPFGTVVYELIPRSALGIFQYLGRVLALNKQDAVRLRGSLDDQTDRRILVLNQDLTGCFTATSYKDEFYCVPENGAENTKRIFSILAELFALNP